MLGMIGTGFESLLSHIRITTFPLMGFDLTVIMILTVGLN